MDIQTADLSITGDNILVLRSPDLRVRADTELTIKGRNNQLTVSGNVVITNALYTKQIPLLSVSSAPSVDSQLQLFSMRGKLGQNTSLDVRITADRTVRLDTNLYRGSFSLDLNFRNRGGTVSVGRVFTDQGRVTLPFSSLNVVNARVLFSEANPFTPVIEARAQTAMQNYNLFVTVSGPLPDLQVTVTSSPPLPPDQAILLLTTGSSTFDILSTAGALETGRTLGTYLSKQLLQRLTGPANPDESSFFDRLDIAVGKEISNAGRETITIEYRLGEGSPWYLIVERDRKDNYNIGVSWRLWFK